MPRFIVMSLGEDHTQGTTPGAHTPAACVASNDLAFSIDQNGVGKSELTDAGGNLSEPYRFLYSPRGLDDNGPGNGGSGCHRFQISHEEISPKNLHATRHPWILGRHVAPEVVVCVDAFVDHRFVILWSFLERGFDSSEQPAILSSTVTLLDRPVKLSLIASPD